MDRAEAIKRFEKQLSSAQVVLDSGFGTRTGENNRLYVERKEMAKIALAALREQEQRGWISVEARLPEDDVRVLVVANGKYENVTFLDAVEPATYSKEEGWILEVCPEWDGVCVSYWMPIPEPPEGMKV